MYTYDVENNISIFDGDFEGYLKDIGVDGEHIKKMQCKILQEDRDRYQDFPDLGSPERDYIQLVPLNKVIGTCRCTVGWSVYENVRKMYRGDREPERFQRCCGYLQELILDELKESYQKLYNPVKMVYYVDDDEYYLSGDGNHRTLMAMLVGAEKIKRLPSVLQNLVLKLQKNDRLEEYINKNYLSEKELTFWNYREPVYLDIL